METEIKNLLEYKILKSSEEKDLKHKIKKTNKKLKYVEEKEAKLVLEKVAFEKSKTKTELPLQESKEEKVEQSLAKEDQEASDNETSDENSNTLQPFYHESLSNPTNFLKIVKEKECIDKKVACFVESIHEFMHSTEVRSSQRIT